MHILLTHHPLHAAEPLIALRDLLASTQMRVLTIQMKAINAETGTLKPIVEAGLDHPVYINNGLPEKAVSSVFSERLIDKKTLLIYTDTDVSFQSAIVEQALKQGQSCLTLQIPEQVKELPLWILNLATEISALVLHSPPPSPCELIFCFETDQIFTSLDYTNLLIRNTTHGLMPELNTWLETIMFKINQRVEIHPSSCSCCATHNT